MTEILPKPTTARVLQVSPKETLIYEMPLATYELIADVMETWHWYHSRRDKCTVEKVLAMMERFAPDVREGVTMKREPTKQEIKGLPADSIWYDEFGFYDEETTEQPRTHENQN